MPHYADTGGYVYLVFDSVSGLHKVGATCRLYDRLRAIAAGTCNDVWLVGYITSNDHIRLELAWKTHWLDHNVRGEWFRLSPEHVAEFKATRRVRYADAEPDAEVLEPHDPLDFPLTHSRSKRRAPLSVGGLIPRGSVDAQKPGSAGRGRRHKGCP